MIYIQNNIIFFKETYIIKNKSNVPEKFLNYKVDLNDLWLIKPLIGFEGVGIGIYLDQNH